MDLLVDTGSDCNLISKCLCKKWGLVLSSCQRILVGFNGKSNSVAGMTSFELHIGN